jgi:hypothetical protein
LLSRRIFESSGAEGARTLDLSIAKTIGLVSPTAAIAPQNRVFPGKNNDSAHDSTASKMCKYCIVYTHKLCKRCGTGRSPCFAEVARSSICGAGSATFTRESVAGSVTVPGVQGVRDSVLLVSFSQSAIDCCDTPSITASCRVRVAAPQRGGDGPVVAVLYGVRNRADSRDG